MKLKKLLSGFLAALMLVTLIPTSVFADDGKGNNDEVEYHSNNKYNQDKDIKLGSFGWTMVKSLKELEFTQDSGTEFRGWAKTKNGSVIAKPGDWLQFRRNDSKNLYAIWGAPAAKSSVTFNANGGQGSDATRELDSGRNLAMPTADGAGFTKAGYTLLGWSESKSFTNNSTNKLYNVNVLYEIPRNVTTFYAVWAPADQSGANLTAYFYLRNDSAIQSEPSNYGNDLYFATRGSAKEMSGKIKQPITIYNDRAAIKANIAVEPSVAEIQAAAKTKSLTFNPETQDVIWYVLKHPGDQTNPESGRWHIDGAILDKTKFAVEYSANKGGGVLPDRIQFAVGATVKPSFEAGKLPTKPGYTFLGWDTNSLAQSATYTVANKATFEMPKNDVTLYAIWQADKSTAFTVNHYPPKEDGTWLGTPSKITPQTAETDSMVYAADFKLSGEYKIDHAEPMEVKIAADGSTVINIYYANAAVTFNSNGGAPEIPQIKAALYGGGLYTQPTEPTRDGYTFKGWNTKADGTGKAFDPTAAIVKDDITVYAQWEAIPKHTVSYNENYVGGKTTVDPTKYAKGETVTPLMDGPKRANYTFDGWYTAADGGTKVTAPYTMGEENVTFYAQWKEESDKWATVTFVTETGANFAPNSETSVHGVIGDSLTAPGYTFDDHYKFDGWYLNGTKVEVPTTIIGTVTYTLKATPIKYDYKVEHYLDGVLDNTVTLDKDGAKLGAAIDTPIKVDDHKVIPDGYLLNSEKSTNITIKGNNDNVLKIYYTANHDDKDNWGQVTYVTEHGTAPTDSKFYFVGKDQATVSKDVMSKKGYTFDGWKYGGKTYQAGATLPAMVKGGIVLTAQWTANDATLTIKYFYDEIDPLTGLYKVAAPMFTQNFKTDDSYSIVSPIIPGYTPNRAVVEEKKMPAEGRIIGVKYKPDYTDANTWHTVTFEAGDHGTLTGTAKFEKIKHGTLFATAVTVPTPVPENGYEFEKWSSPLPTTVTANTTHTAQWKKLTYSYEVRHHYPDSDGYGTTLVQDASYGDPITVEKYKDTAAGIYDVDVSNTDIDTIVTKDGQVFNIYYKKAADKWFGITYDVNGGTAVPDGEDVLVGTLATVTTQKPTKDGYTFGGWSYNDKHYTESTIAMVEGGIELTAVWTANSYGYTVKHINDVTNKTFRTDTGKAPFDTEYQTVFATLADFVPTVTDAPKISITTEPTKNVAEIHYKRDESKAFSVTYDGNGADVDTVPTDSGKYYTGDTATVGKAPTKLGNEFLGWSDGRVKMLYQAGAELTITGNVTLTAQWKANMYDLTVHYKLAAESAGQVAPPTHTEQVKYGTPYAVTSPDVSSHTADRLVVAGDMPAENLTVEVIYTKNEFPTYVFEYYAGDQMIPSATKTAKRVGVVIPLASADVNGYGTALSAKLGAHYVFDYAEPEAFTIADGYNVFKIHYKAGPKPSVNPNGQINVEHKYWLNETTLETTVPESITSVEITDQNVVDTVTWRRKGNDYKYWNTEDPVIKALENKPTVEVLRMARMAPINPELAALTEEEKAAKIEALQLEAAQLEKDLKSAVAAIVAKEKENGTEEITPEDISELLTQYESAMEVDTRKLEERIAELTAEIEKLEPKEQESNSSDKREEEPAPETPEAPATPETTDPVTDGTETTPDKTPETPDAKPEEPAPEAAIETPETTTETPAPAMLTMAAPATKETPAAPVVPETPATPPTTEGTIPPTTEGTIPPTTEGTTPPTTEGTTPPTTEGTTPPTTGEGTPPTTEVAPPVPTVPEVIVPVDPEQAEKDAAELAAKQAEKLHEMKIEVGKLQTELDEAIEIRDNKAMLRSAIKVSKLLKDTRRSLYEFGIGEDPLAAVINEKVELTDGQFIFDPAYSYVITINYNRTGSAVTPPVNPGPGPGPGGGGGGGDDADTTPTRPNRPTTTIPDVAVPLGAGPNPKLFTILDEDVPLGALPKSGGTATKSFAGFGIAALGLAAALLKALRKEDKDN